MYNWVITLIATFSWAYHAASQLSGTYTVGVSGDDFMTIQEVIDTIEQSGMSSTVIIEVSSGDYPSIELNNIVPPPGEKLIFKSGTSNALDVVFSLGSITNCERVEFHDLSFVMPFPGTEYSLLSVITSHDIRLLRCRIIDGYNSDTVWYHGALEIDLGWSNGPRKVYIDSCFIQSLENQLSYSASRQTVLVKGQGGKTFFHNDTIDGSFDFTFNESREFKKCVMFMSRDIFAVGTDFIDSCEIHFSLPNSAPGSYDLRAGQITNNILFTDNGYLNLSSKTVLNNYVEGNAHCSGGNNSLHQNNYFDGDFDYYVPSWTFNGINALVESNIIKGDSYISGSSTGSPPTYLVNNSFFGHVVSSGPGSTVHFYHNNFKEGHFFVCHNYGDMINNNFGDLSFDFVGAILQNGSNAINLSHNNYNIQDSSSYHYSYYDDRPTYYDPAFDTLQGLHITNPAIFTSALFLPQTFLQLDMDDEARDQMRSIGADETCLNFQYQDTIFVACGSIYNLGLCDSLGTGFYWTPGALLIDSTAVQPEVLVDTVKTLFLLDAIGNHVDTVVLAPVFLASRKRNLYGTCNFNYSLATYNQPGATINWSPGYLFSDSTSYFTSISLDTTTEIVAVQDLGQCGVRYDSITFNINTVPQAFIYVDTQACVGRGFQSITRCFDSTRWTISDGTIYENLTAIWHEFPSVGFYEIIYTVWMDGMVDSDTLSGMVDCVNLHELTSEDLKMFPNPADEILTIEVPDGLIGSTYSIMSATGQKVLEGILRDSKVTIDVSGLSNGVYLIRTITNSQKLIIQDQ